MTFQFLNQLNNKFGYTINLKDVFWHDVKLKELNFLTNLDLSFSKLVNISFEKSDLSFSNFEFTELDNISFKQAFMEGTKFNKSKLLCTDMKYAHLRRCYFMSCVLEDFRGQNTAFEYCFFQRAKISKATFNKSNLSHADFKEAILSDIDFTDTNLNDVDFRGADLAGINLHVAQQTDLIRIDYKSIFNYATVDSTFVPKLLRCNSKNLKGLKIYDVQKNEIISLEEYKKRYNNN